MPKSIKNKVNKDKISKKHQSSSLDESSNKNGCEYLYYGSCFEESTIEDSKIGGIPVNLNLI